MLVPLTAPTQISAFSTACSYEHVFGSRALSALRAYGPGDVRARFYLCVEDGFPAAALCLSGGVLSVSADGRANPGEIAALAQAERVGEIDADRTLTDALQRLLGGTIDSSYFMVYRGGPQSGMFPDLVPGDLRTVFSILQQSHEYYRQHLQYESWSADLRLRLSKGLAEVWQLEVDGQPVGTGSIASEDDECGIIAAVAVVPEFRHRGLGGCISRFLTGRIQKKGKTPRLISGNDGVAELYRQVGFETCGRWGELYL
ncbi:GNAT family N-acetyltransferase [Oscillibacter sp.]|uniref:GNAT family N-acetyltransferase n=1 Tax=Oscillibacter sp. TaxID=1945593 RepID=UPI00289CDA0C|nr:GNAT family N-acetyltransferase [Oscillibacter sp.]